MFNCCSLRFMLPISHFVPNLCSEKNPGMSTARYQDPIPEGVCVFPTLDEAAKIQLENPAASLYPVHNGHYIKNPDGAVIAVAADEICEELGRRTAELDAKIAAGELTD